MVVVLILFVEKHVMLATFFFEFICSTLSMTVWYLVLNVYTVSV